MITGRRKVGKVGWIELEERLLAVELQYTALRDEVVRSKHQLDWLTHAREASEATHVTPARADEVAAEGGRGFVAPDVVAPRAEGAEGVVAIEVAGGGEEPR